jgi:hypothetical protein
VRITRTSTSAGAAQSENVVSSTFPVTSGTAEQMRCASGNAVDSQVSRPDDGGGITLPSRRAKAAAKRLTRSSLPLAKSGTLDDGRG